MECNHLYNLLEPIACTQRRMQCQRCKEVSLLPGQERVWERIASDSRGTNAQFALAVVQLLIIQYERETGLPYFTGSIDYAEWVKSKRNAY